MSHVRMVPCADDVNVCTGSYWNTSQGLESAQYACSTRPFLVPSAGISFIDYTALPHWRQMGRLRLRLCTQEVTPHRKFCSVLLLPSPAMDV